MISKRNKILYSILLSWLLCFGTVHAENVCGLETRDCFVTFRAPACSSGCTEADDHKDVPKFNRATQLPENCCDIQTCRPAKSRYTGIQQSNRHVQHSNIPIAPSLNQDNRLRLHPGINHTVPRTRVKLYTMVQSFLC